MERRPDKGLLGGMLGWPGSDWIDADAPRPTGTPPTSADWKAAEGEVRHTFTHFHLLLTVMTASVDSDEQLLFLGHNDFRPSDLPTVMRKAFDLIEK